MKIYLDEIFDKGFFEGISERDVCTKAKAMADAARREKHELTVKASRMPLAQVYNIIESVADNPGEPKCKLFTREWHFGMEAALELVQRELAFVFEDASNVGTEEIRVQKSEIIALLYEFLDDTTVVNIRARQYFDGWNSAITEVIDAISDLPVREYKITPDELEAKAEWYRAMLALRTIHG